MKAKIDADACTGCELCTTIAPDIFEMDGDIAKTIVDDVPTSQEDDAREAAESCPVEAIELS